MQSQQLDFGLSIARSPTLRVLRETPAARVLSGGETSLLEEVSAIVGDPDIALRLLADYPTVFDLQRAGPVEIGGIKGMGPQRTAALKAALNLGCRLAAATPDDRPQIRCPADAAHLLLAEMSALDREQMRVVILDTRNRVLAIPTIYMGSLDTVVVRTAELFREAIRRNAASIIVVHNHPGMDPCPSLEDISTTRAIISAGKLLDIDTIDHLIIGGGQYVSLKERGLGFE